MGRFALPAKGHRATVGAGPGTALLYVPRNDLGLHAAKFGCGLGQCGACTVLVGGRATRSCVIPVKAIAAQPVTTLEGLGSPARPHPLQAAVIDAQEAQCGYRIAGNGGAAQARAAIPPLA